MSVTVGKHVSMQSCCCWTVKAAVPECIIHWISCFHRAGLDLKRARFEFAARFDCFQMVTDQHDVFLQGPCEYFDFLLSSSGKDLHLSPRWLALTAWLFFVVAFSESRHLSCRNIQEKDVLRQHDAVVKVCHVICKYLQLASRFVCSLDSTPTLQFFYCVN